MAEPSPQVTSSSSPLALLPAELILDILSLCDASSRLPTACRMTATGFFRVGAQPHRVWSHRQVFLNPQCDPQLVRAGATFDNNKSHEMNLWTRQVSQMESHVANYLKLNVPAGDGPFGFAGGIAPQPPGGDPKSVAEGTGNPGAATMITAEFVEWLFWDSGPPRDDWPTELVCVWHQSMIEMFPPQTDLPASAVVPNWRLIPDAFLLIHFFIRTTQLNLLERTLVHLQSALSTLATVYAPFSLWSHFMLDNRASLRFRLSNFVQSHNDPTMTYPTFICLLSLLEWSKPTLDVISHAFAQSLDLPAIAHLVTSHHDHDDMFTCMIVNLALLTSPSSTSARVLDILNWFSQHGAEINLDRFPTISQHITGSYPIFADVFVQHDIRNLDRAPDRARADLGAEIVDWVVAGHTDLVPVALQHGLLSDQLLATVLRDAVLTGDEGLAAMVASHCGRDKVLMKRMAIFALNLNGDTDPDPPAFYSSLFNILFTHAMDPNTFLVERSNHVPPCAMSVILFGCPSHDLLFSWNHHDHLRHQLERAKSLSKIDMAWSVFMSRFIDGYLDAWMRSEQVGVDLTALACAIRLIGFRFTRAVVGDLDRSSEVEYKQDVDLVAALASRTVETLRLAVDAPTCDGTVSFSSVIPSAVKNTLQQSIAAAATMLAPIPPESLDAAIARSADARSFFLDTLLNLDRIFTLNSIPFATAATVYVWPRFQEHELASRLSVDTALGMVQQMVEDKSVGVVSEILKHLPRAIRDSEAFILGVREMVRMQWLSDGEDAMVLGLELSGWGGWVEKGSV